MTRRFTFLLSCIDTKRAIEGNKVEFGTDQFRAAVQYAKDNFVYDNENSVPKEYVQDWSRYRGECYYAKIGDYLDFITACYKPKESYTIIGTPSTDASGPRFKATETVSVAANTAVKDGCKKFLNYMFSGAAYNSDDCEFRFIVTNKAVAPFLCPQFFPASGSFPMSRLFASGSQGIGASA